MRFLSLIKIASLLMAANTFAAPAPTQEIDHSTFAFDTTGLSPEKFVAEDGVEHTIWVAKEFSPIEESDSGNETTTGDLESRQRIPNLISWSGKDTFQDKCRQSSFYNDIGPHAPTTGRCKALRDWANQNNGLWSIGWRDITPHQYRALLRNGNCYFGVYHIAIRVRIGNTDVRDIIRDSLNKYSKWNNGAYRVRANGAADCDGDLVEDGSAQLLWRLTDVEHIG